MIKIFKKVFLCVPPLVGEHGWPNLPHSGMGYLSAMLSKYGIENKFFDIRLGKSLSDLEKEIAQYSPDLVCVTVMTYRRNIIYNLIEKIKSDKYKIAVGGPHASIMRKEILKECPADFAVKHEGEFTLLELCQNDNLSDIPGLIYRNGKEIIENPDRPSIKNLDELPFPTYPGMDLRELRDYQVPIISSRGCPFSCIFCSIKTFMGKPVRMRSAEHVFEEIKYWYNKGFRKFNFNDDHFLFDKERVKKICALIEKNNFKDISLIAGNGVRADSIDRDLLTTMKKAGFKHLVIAAECGNNKILKVIKKGETIESIEKSIELACELDFDVVLFFMLGHPHETLEDIEDTFKLALKYPIKHAAFYNIIPMPGTELFEWVKENDCFLIKPEVYLNNSQEFSDNPLFETPELKRNDRIKILKKGKEIQKLIAKRVFEANMKQLSAAQRIKARMFSLFSKVINFQGFVRFINRRLTFPYKTNKKLREILNILSLKIGIKTSF